VVSETLHYSVPGGFLSGRNYLAFDDPAQCVEQVARLVADPAATYAMKVANYRYYHAYVRPDRLVLNTLMIALRVAGQGSGSTAESPT
jgi:hypothetical protein